MQIIRPERNIYYHSSINPMLGITAGGSSWLVDEIWVEPKELEFLDYEQDVTSRFEELQASQQINSDSIKYARNNGVENEWEMINFFASEDVNAPSSILQYVNDNGDLVSFTEEELEAIRNWQPGEANPVKGLEGHHIATIRENPDNIQLANDSDNIILATDIGHRQHLHGGSTSNPTQDAYLYVKISNEERLSETLAFNENEIVPGFFEAATGTMASSIIIGVTIGQVITLYQLKNDPRPWNQKGKIMANSALVSTLISAGAGAVAYSSSTILEASFNDITAGTIDQFFTDMIGMNGSILTVQLAMATVSYIRAVKKGVNARQALNRYKSEMITAVAEFAAFSVLGIGLEIGADMLGGLLLDALIPDPTGVLIALRVSYSLFKMGSKMFDKKNHQEAYKNCIEIRQRHSYEIARAAV